MLLEQEVGRVYASRRAPARRRDRHAARVTLARTLHHLANRIDPRVDPAPAAYDL